ncbi:MAG: hypothetical protein ACFCBW_03225 [Candidatus Competibacterales bacterium]
MKPTILPVSMASHGQGQWQPHSILIGLGIACFVLLVAGIFIDKHGYFSFADWFGFFELFGLAVSFILVAITWLWRSLVGRESSYYD